jgi:MFS family permease
MIEVLGTLAVYVVGSIITLIVTGFLADRFVLKRIMRNKDVKETLELFKEGRELLKEIVEEQKRKRAAG